MTLTYTDDHARPYGETPAARAGGPYGPVYARGMVRYLDDALARRTSRDE